VCFSVYVDFFLKIVYDIVVMGSILPRMSRGGRRARKSSIRGLILTMRRDILLPALVLAGGAGGFVLRRWQWASAYDVSTQLFRPGAPATWALLGLLGALALIVLALCWGMKRREDFLSAYRCPAAPFMSAMAASAFLFLGAGMLGLADGMGALASWQEDRAAAALMAVPAPPVTYPVALLLRAALCFPAGLAVLLMGKAAYRGEPSSAASRLACAPPFAGLAWLFATHLDHGSDPQLLRYGLTLLAVGLLTLAHYGAAEAFFVRQHSRRTVLCALMGTAVGLLTLADPISRSAALLLAAFLLSSLAYAYALLRNQYGPAWPDRMPEGAEEETAPEGHEGNER